MDSYFKISERGSTLGREIRAGIVTFITMAYILPVNAGILSACGMDYNAVFAATAIASALGTLLMGLYANLPLAQAPGMGLNAYFAYSVVIGMGVDPGYALAAVFVEGVIFIVLSLTNVRTKLLQAIPEQLRLAIAASIGLFIAFIGLQNGGIVVSSATLVTVASPFSVTVWLSLIGLVIMIIATIRGWKGALLIGIAATTVLGILAQLAGLYVPNPEAGAYSLIPSAILSSPPSLAPTFGLFAKGLSSAFSSTASIGAFAVVVLSFLYVDIFDTMGTFTAVMTRTGMIDKSGEFPGAKRGFLSDAVATTAGAVLGTSTVTTYVESSSGVEEGGRTGVTAITVGVLFLLSLFLAPLFGAIQSFATAPALIIVGILMMQPLLNLEWGNLVALTPAVITMIFTIFGYSISTGIVFGVLSYIVVNLAAGKAKEIKPIMWGLGALFIAKLLFM